MLLGIDTFSLRWQGWDAFQLMDYTASLGLDNIHFSERANLESLETPYLESIRAHADALGLRIEIGMRSFDRFSTTFDPELGMPSDRLGDVPFDQHIAEAARTLRAAAPLAEQLAIAIAVENHGGVDFLAPELRDLIESVGSNFVRVCLDTGNPVYAAEDAVFAAETLAPYIVTTHLRDTRIWATRDGAMVQWAPAGDGNVDLRRIVEIVERHAPNSAIDLEIITGVAPKAIPYLDAASDFWRLYPAMPARDFAHFLAVANRGTPEPLEQRCLEPGVWAPPPDQLDAFRAQQREHLERSVAYCRNVLGIGS